MKELLGFRCLSPNAQPGRASWKEGLTPEQIAAITKNGNDKYQGPDFRGVQLINKFRKENADKSVPVPDMDPEYMEHQFDRPENQ